MQCPISFVYLSKTTKHVLGTTELAKLRRINKIVPGLAFEMNSTICPPPLILTSFSTFTPPRLIYHQELFIATKQFLVYSVLDYSHRLFYFL
jgi:hypothetical protein